ncbi:MAG: type II secretion system protein [bacterium]|nr:type II secretion system protein [bacterium]
MKNKKIIIVLAIIGVILAVLIGVYFLFFQKTAQLNLNNTAEETADNATENQTPTTNQGKTENGIVTDNQPSPEQSQNKIITDDFSINLPPGWSKTEAAAGVSAMAFDTNEIIKDSAAQKINFKSYLAVVFDALQGKTLDEYLQNLKNSLLQTIPNTVFTKEQDMTISGKLGHAMEVELSQQGVNFKILTVFVKDEKEENVWIITFNTIKSSWDGYKESFYNTANSFVLKK